MTEPKKWTHNSVNKLIYDFNATYPLNGTNVVSSSHRQDTGAIPSPQGDFSRNFFFNAAFKSTSTVSPSGQVQDSKSTGRSSFTKNTKQSTDLDKTHRSAD